MILETPQMILRTCRRALHNLCPLDLYVFTFLIYFNLVLWGASESPDASYARVAVGVGLALWTSAVLLSRGEALTHPRARGIIHRFSLLLSVLGLYLASMRQALAALKPELVDAQLAALDRAIFGEVPAQLFERFATPTLTEWLAFCYFCYFLIVILSTFPSAFFGRSTLSRGLVSGSILIVCIGHMIYTLVPGRGPYVALTFQAELEGGFFWDVVNQMVVAQGALLDIFPSLHTALPSFVVIYLARCRAQWTLRIPWAAVWSVLLFFTVNIIISTLYLRWHYAVDVIGGLLLAGITAWVTTRFNPTDSERAERGRQPIFEPCLGRSEEV